MRSNILILSLAIMVLGIPAEPLPAQTQQKTQTAFGGSPLFWSIDSVLNLYVKTMTREYNLDETQEEYTRKLLTKRVKSFLVEYETDVRSLTSELYDYQLKGEMPPGEIVKDWSRRGLPLMTAIRKEIWDGNMTWRKILRDDQLKKHDQDLELMKKQFDTYEERLQRWSRGEMRASDFPGMVSKRAPTIMKGEDAWEYTVRNFIQSYNLDERQKQTAYSILRKMREEAKMYREAHKKEFAQLEAQYQALREAVASGDTEKLVRNREQSKKLLDRRREIERPISVDMYDRLKTQLNKIPTTEQRRDHEEHIAKLKKLAGRDQKNATSQSQPAGTTTQPSATEPS